jgi:hypothetical protein
LAWDAPRVELRHLKQEDMGITVFAAQDNGYERFHPYNNLKSWVLECDVDPGFGDVQVLGSIVPSEDAVSGHLSKLYFIYTGVYEYGRPITDRGIIKSGLTTVRGIVVREVTQRVFCRVGTWDRGSKVAIKDFGKMPTSVEQLLAILLNVENKKHLKDSDGPELPATFTNQWERRTLWII